MMKFKLKHIIDLSCGKYDEHKILRLFMNSDELKRFLFFSPHSFYVDVSDKSFAMKIDRIVSVDLQDNYTDVLPCQEIQKALNMKFIQERKTKKSKKKGE